MSDGNEERLTVRTRKSWLKNSELRTLDDGQVSWSRFSPPDLSARSGDLQYTVRRHERPEQIAMHFYGIPELWWVIAVANQITLPLIEFRQGRTLRIPDPGYILDRVARPGPVR